MGAAMWLAAGVLAFTTARFVRLRRTERWRLELIVSVSLAIALGVAATALDFGGWNELDWRAGLFAFFGAIAGAGAVRALRR